MSPMIWPFTPAKTEKLWEVTYNLFDDDNVTVFMTGANKAEARRNAIDEFGHGIKIVAVKRCYRE